jgi:hypothetical protein
MGPRWPGSIRRASNIHTLRPEGMWEDSVDAAENARVAHGMTVRELRPWARKEFVSRRPPSDLAPSYQEMAPAPL